MIQCIVYEILKIAVKPQWIYNGTKNSDKKSLPDAIKFNLELESSKVTLNLIRQSTEPIKQPLIITGLEGQSSIWKQSEEVSCTNMIE